MRATGTSSSHAGPRLDLLSSPATVRYAFALVAVAAALAIRVLLFPLTGLGAPFGLLLAATLVTSLVAGSGPGFVAVALSLPLAAYLYIVRAGYPVSEAAVQTVVYGVDGLVIVYLTFLMNTRRRLLDEANSELRRVSEDAARSEARTRQIIELAPDAYFVADLDARYTDVNPAACKLLGYERDELVGMTIFDLIRPEDAYKLETERADLLVPGAVARSEWMLRRKDGKVITTEVSANILPDGRWQAFVRDITERKRIEDERRVLVSLLDNSPDFVAVADTTGTPIYINAAGRRMVGLALDFPVRQTRVTDYYPPELSSFVMDVILKTTSERGHWSGETYFQHFGTRERIPVSEDAFVIRDASGERILGLGTVVRDITEARKKADEREQLLGREQLARRQAEVANEQLRESEERFRLTIDEAPIGMGLVSLDGRFVRVNRALCEITGYSADELTKLRFQDITHPEDLNTDADLTAQVFRGEIPRYQLEKRYIRKDGSIVDVMLSASVLRGHDGTPRYGIAQIQDITERKQAETALRLSEAKFSGIVSIAADAIISVDEQQHITVFNEGAERIFGYSKSEVIGTPLERLIPERFRAIHRVHFAHFAAAPETSRAVRPEAFGLRKNGEEFPAEASISKVTVGGAHIFSVVLRDITSRKRVEEALRRAMNAREQVLGIVAHDLRNPLSTIILQASAMERVGSEPERRDPTSREIISRAATRMNQLIQDLLDVSVVEAGELKVKRERCSTADLARDAVQMQAPLAVEAGVELRLDVAPGVRDVWGDRHRLLQVFENLIGNAITFTKAGGVITVKAAPKDREVLFSITDSGAGIARESLPHVFDRFWQATTRAGRLGAGLGLPITKGIVEAHGGRIWAESEIGRGSTFFFTIPAVQAEGEKATDERRRRRRRAERRA